jgi:2-dehydro-3-deoxy-L-rhamnonate dehydrogenase (NAD+)
VAFFDLSGRVALVAGGSRGIGLATARRLGLAGARVAVVGRTDRSGEQAAAGLAAEGIEAFGLGAEATDASAVADAHRRVADEVGPVDALVVTAGTVGPSAPVWEYDLAEVRRIVDVNLFGTIHWCRAVVPAMRERGSGAVVTVSSVGAKEGNPQQSAYCASKAAVIALTKSLAKEVVDDGILVNCIAPGIVATELSRNTPPKTVDYILSKVPMGRMGEPEEIAAIVHLLASGEASFTTGQVYDASGGRASF